MGKLLRMVGRRSPQGETVTVSTTPVAADFAAFRRAIEHGTGPARGLHGPTRQEALRGLGMMLHRCPHILVVCRDTGDVTSLVEYARSRKG